jgi:hypothetical protein
MPASKGSFIVAIKPKGKENIGMNVMLLLYILQKNYYNEIANFLKM